MPDEEKSGRAKRIRRSVKLIKDVISPTVAPKKEFVWPEILAAMAELVGDQTKEAEDTLAGILEFEGSIRLAAESDIPSAMLPEDMLKSLAIQVLSEWAGRKHLRAFERIYATTRSPILSGTAKVHIERLGGELRKPIP